MICKHCNHENERGANFCRSCGRPLNENENKKTDINNDKNLNNNNITQKIIIAISCIVVISAVVFIVYRFDIFGGNKGDSIESVQHTTNSDTSNQNSSSDNDNQSNSSQKAEVLNISNSDCSSILHDSTSINYGSAKAIDGDFSTVWSEGVSGYGEGEWLRLDLDSTYTIQKIKIVNGLVNKNNGYYNNNRPKSLTLSFSDGSSQTIYLEDDNMGYQLVEINPVKSNFVKFTINSVYSGSKYDDTCIADIEILGY